MPRSGAQDSVLRDTALTPQEQGGVKANSERHWAAEAERGWMHCMMAWQEHGISSLVFDLTAMDIVDTTALNALIAIIEVIQCAHRYR